MGSLSSLAKRSLVLVFAYAPAGFGHLRVTDALYHGLPKGVAPLLLGSQDTSITFFHRLTSIHPWARTLFEWAQSGWPESVFTFLYRSFLRLRTKLIYQQMVTILEERIDTPDTILIVATHFGLAHQLAVIKKKLEKEKKVKIILVAQVTDDSPQYIWYIEGADLIFTPSQVTKNKLLEYGKKMRMNPVRFEVVPYPVSPLFSVSLNSKVNHERVSQTSPEGVAHIHLAVPVSGAAVGTKFFIELIDSLHQNSSRFVFHVISKASLYTQIFLNQMLERSYVNLHVSSNDRGVLDQYEELYKTHPIALEVTKPSEQAFKALFNPSQIGGSILLFSEPIGRQEYDNLDFLRRHRLIPHIPDQLKMWEYAQKGKNITQELLQTSKGWRGLEIPTDPHHASTFIYWALKQGLFEKMMHWESVYSQAELAKNELGPDGVYKFWDKVAQFLDTQN